MPNSKPVAESAENIPLTIKEVFGWTSAGVTIISLIITGVIAFCHVESRCDLVEQAIATMKIERGESRASRDKQIDSINSRCDATDRTQTGLSQTVAGIQSSLAVLSSRQDDMLTLLKKIDDHINGRSAETR